MIVLTRASRRRVRPLAALAGGLVLLEAVVSAGRAQSPPPVAPPPEAASPAAPAPSPGLIGTIGNWIGRSTDEVVTRFKGASPPPAAPAPAANPPEAAAPAPGAAEPALPALPGRLVSGRVLCATAANGAPDCKAAADALCRSKGLGSGRSLGSETAENCPVQVLLTGKRSPGDCKMETFVTRAVCQ